MQAAKILADRKLMLSLLGILNSSVDKELLVIVFDTLRNILLRVSPAEATAFIFNNDLIKEIVRKLGNLEETDAMLEAALGCLTGILKTSERLQNQSSLKVVAEICAHEGLKKLEIEKVRESKGKSERMCSVVVKAPDRICEREQTMIGR